MTIMSPFKLYPSIKERKHPPNVYIHLWLHVVFFWLPPLEHLMTVMLEVFYAKFSTNTNELKFIVIKPSAILYISKEFVLVYNFFLRCLFLLLLSRLPRVKPCPPPFLMLLQCGGQKAKDWVMEDPPVLIFNCNAGNWEHLQSQGV